MPTPIYNYYAVYRIMHLNIELSYYDTRQTINIIIYQTLFVIIKHTRCNRNKSIIKIKIVKRVKKIIKLI